eukprot:gene35893-46597_t
MTSIPPSSVKINEKPWTELEDEKLLRLLDEKRSKEKWSKIASKLGINRTGKQCRERFKNNLCPKLKKGDWTSAEDRIVIEMTKILGKHWTRIANLLPGKSGNAVKNRWRLIERFAGKDRRSHSRMKPQQLIDTVDKNELIGMVAPMVLHHHCNYHGVEHSSEHDHDSSVDCEGRNPHTEAKVGCFEDDWVDDITQMAQLHIPIEEKACDAMMVTPSPRTPIIPILSVDDLFHSHVNYPTLNMFIGSAPRYCTVSYLSYSD